MSQTHQDMESKVQTIEEQQSLIEEEKEKSLALEQELNTLKSQQREQHTAKDSKEVLGKGHIYNNKTAQATETITMTQEEYQKKKELERQKLEKRIRKEILDDQQKTPKRGIYKILPALCVIGVPIGFIWWLFSKARAS